MQEYNAQLNSGYTPNDITLITFRKSSAEDLINLTTAKTGLSINSIKHHVGTVHSICWRLGGYPEVMTSEDYIQFIKDYKYTNYFKKQAHPKDEEDTVYSGDLFDLYTWLRNTDTNPDKCHKYPGFKNILLPKQKIPDFLHDF